MTTEIQREFIDSDVLKVVRRLQRSNFIVYLVGGSVRDLLIGRMPKDFDLVTDAKPSEIKKLFRNSRIIGRRFKLAHIFFGEDKIFETSTFRAEPVGKEGDEDLLILSDNKFGTPEEDAKRRDFTVNGLFYDVTHDAIIDYVDGMQDIEARSLKTIGNPDVRFQEDPVRILRAIRFAAKLGFTIESETEKYLKIHRSALKLASRRRLVDEMWKTLLGGAVEQTLPLMKETGVLKELLPEIDLKLDDPKNLAMMLKSCALIDLFHQHPIMSLSLTAPIFFQFWIEDLLSAIRVKGNEVSRVYKEELHQMLVNYGLSRMQRDAIHRILHVIVQLGHPSELGKIPVKLKRKEYFWPAYLAWQILWHVRGELPRFDLPPFFKPIEELMPPVDRPPERRGRRRGRRPGAGGEAEGEPSRTGALPRAVPAARSETPKSRRARSRSRSRSRRPAQQKDPVNNET